MQLRFILPGILWTFMMFLLFFTSSHKESLAFEFIPYRSILHGFFFWGFTHIWLTALKKQLKYDNIRRNAVTITAGLAILIAAISEVIMHEVGITQSASFWNLFFDFLGSILGILSFKLLYSTCC